MAIKQFVFAGDSLSMGTVGASSIYQGGKGSWAELVTERLANLPEIGPLISSGIRGCWLGLVGTNPCEWTFSGSWTDVVSTDAWDKAPYGGSGIGGSQYANGSSNVATWTRSVWMRHIVGFAIYWIDYTNGGNWQYRIDGGTWTNMGQTLVHDNKMCKFYINTAVTSSVDIRAFNGTSGVGCLPVGIELFYTNPTVGGLSGFIAHNIAINGSLLHELTATTSGDRMAFFDSVKLGTGSPITNQPNVGVISMNINDVQLNNTTTWGNDLTSLYNRVSPLGPVGFMSPWLGSEGSSSLQASYRAKTKTIAASLGASVFDLFDEWSSNGWSTLALENAAGLLLDNLHESQIGNLDIALRVYWFVRNEILTSSITSALPNWTAKATTSSVAGYRASSSTASYTASAPMFIPD